ncbi:MAG: S9 family peptidase [Candidatus Heimdallarchaeota archaeon]
MNLNELKQILDIPDLILLDIAHSGEFLLVISNKSDFHQVYRINLDELDKWINITDVGERIVFGALSPDDSKFVFPKEQGGNEKHDLYLTDLISNKPNLLLKLDSIRVFTIEWTPDAQSILFSGSSETDICLWKYDLPKAELKTIYQTERLPVDGFFQVNPQQPLISWAEIKPDNPTASTVRIINYHTGAIDSEIEASRDSINNSMAWSEDGLNLLLSSDAPGDPSLAVWQKADDSLAFLQGTKKGLAIDYTSAVWVPGKTEIIYSAKKNGSTKIYVENWQDQETPVELPIPEGWVEPLRTVKGNSEQFYFTWSSMGSPTQIHEYNIIQKKAKKLIDSMPSNFPLPLSQGKFLTYPSFDSREIPAFLVKPPNGRQLPGEPVIILIHGGPSWEFSQDWQAMGNIIQLYAGAGFTVFCPNIRGSTGYGKEFLQLNLGDLGGGDLQDVIYALNYLRERYPQGGFHFLTGASYGGFMTFLTLTKHPGLFDGGAAIVGITDWFEMHRLGDRIFQAFTERFFLGPPEDRSELYEDRSAINFLENLADPLYIVHRANDSRCPIDPIYTFFGKAMSLKKDVEIYVERKAGHGFQKTEHLKVQYGGVVEFFLGLLRKGTS